MEREETVKLYREIITECKFQLASVSIISPRISDTLSEGYQLDISSSLEPSDKERLQNILNKYSLAYREMNGKIIIYKPKKAESFVA